MKWKLEVYGEEVLGLRSTFAGDDGVEIKMAATVEFKVQGGYQGMAQ